jgi:hypothetical protein
VATVVVQAELVYSSQLLEWQWDYKTHYKERDVKKFAVLATCCMAPLVTMSSMASAQFCGVSTPVPQCPNSSHPAAMLVMGEVLDYDDGRMLIFGRATQANGEADKYLHDATILIFTSTQNLPDYVTLPLKVQARFNGSYRGIHCFVEKRHIFGGRDVYVFADCK